MMVGYAYVVGDIIHEGHLLHLRNCKKLCDKLIVGVLTDEAVMEKKPRPTMAFAERIQVIAALEYVDAAVAQESYYPYKNVTAMGIDILFESMDHDLVETMLLLEEEGFRGRVMPMPYYPEQSSSKIKQKIMRG